MPGDSARMVDTARGPVHFQRLASENGTGAPPLVILHGGGPGCHASADFGEAIPLLRSRELILLDLPGYGRSPLHRPPGPRFTGYAHVLESLLETLSIDTCDILAQSLGGIAALTLSALHPNRVRRIVAIGSQPVPAPPGIRVDPALGARAREQYYGGPTSAETLRSEVMALEWHDTNAIPVDLVQARYAASVSPAGLAAAADPRVLGTPEDLSWMPGRVAAPTLLLSGIHDPFGEPAYGRWLARQLPHGIHAVLDRTAHHPQSENPSETVRLMHKHFDSEHKPEHHAKG